MGLGFRVHGLGFMGLSFKVYGCRVCGFRVRWVWDLGHTHPSALALSSM